MAYTLVAARVNKGLLQQDAARILGVSPETLSSWEKGRTFPDVPHIQKIEDLYGVPYSELIFCPANSVKPKKGADNA